jgi:hypothetical protein
VKRSPGVVAGAGANENAGGGAMATGLKAIETVYNGYRFRSRLEARWAVFFDVLGVKYRYEPEGFDFGPGGWYLPDFEVAEWGVYVEIKPDLKWKSPEHLDARQKCWNLAGHMNRKVLLIRGDPWPLEYGLEVFGELQFEQCMFGQCRKCENIWLVSYDAGATMIGGRPCEREMDKFPLYDERAPAVMRAFTAARQARFERGERPR